MDVHCQSTFHPTLGWHKIMSALNLLFLLLVLFTLLPLFQNLAKWYYDCEVPVIKRTWILYISNAGTNDTTCIIMKS